jgi:hypothetical protein
MQREDAFDTFIADDAPYGEGFVNASSFSTNDHSGKDLDACFASFLDAAAHVDGISNLKKRHLVFKAFGFH